MENKSIQKTSFQGIWKEVEKNEFLFFIFFPFFMIFQNAFCRQA